MTIFRSRKDDRHSPAGVANRTDLFETKLSDSGKLPLRADPHVTGEAGAGAGGVARAWLGAWPASRALPAGDVIMVRGLTWPVHRSDGKHAGGAAGGTHPVQTGTVTAP